MCLVRAPDSDRPDSATDPRRPPTSSHSSFLRENTRLGDISPRERGLSELSRRLLRVDFERLTMDMRCICTAASNLSLSDHIVAQQANRYIVAFHIAISRYRTIRSGLDITGGL